MAGHEPPGQAAKPGWQQRLQEGSLPVGLSQPVQVPIAGADPYFLWAAVNRGLRVGEIRPAGRPAQAAPVPALSDCRVPSFHRPAHYLQVLIQVADDLDQAADRRRHANLRQHLRDSSGGLRLRGAAKLAGVSSDPAAPASRFVVGLVADWWLPCFLQRIGGDSLRWEMVHSRTPVDVRWPRRGTAAGRPAAPQDWQAEDRLLDGDVMVVIDHGCPFAHPAFREGNRSRIRYVWFQGADALTGARRLPLVRSHGGEKVLFPYGVELRGSHIDALMDRHQVNGRIDEAACYEALGYDLMREASTHGAHVLDIACGNENPLSRQPGEAWLSGIGFEAADDMGPPVRDGASEAKIIFVEMPRQSVADTSGGSMGAHLIDALNYVLHRTTGTARVTVNCSFGTHGGPHDGSSMLEQAIDEVLSRDPSRHIQLVVPIGNACHSHCHAHGRLAFGQALALTVDIPADKATDTFIELWWPRQHLGEAIGGDSLAVELRSPDGQALVLPPGAAMAWWHRHPAAVAPLVTVVQVPDATPTRHRVLIAVAPTALPGGSDADAAPYGHWQLTVTSRHPTGAPLPVDAWIERDDPVFGSASDRQARFVVHAGRKPSEPIDPDERLGHPAVTQEGTSTGLSSSAAGRAVGALVRPTVRDGVATAMGTRPHLAVYSSAASAWLQPGPAASTSREPMALAWVDDSSVLLGRNAAGNHGRCRVRRNGTSVAAPQVARLLLNLRGSPPTGLNGRQPNLDGQRGDGLSAAGADLQRLRWGGGPVVPW